MKKPALLLSFLLVCFCFTSSSFADHRTAINEEPLEKGQLLVYAEEYPEGMLEYAYENLERHLISILLDRTVVLQGAKVSLGHPFSIWSPVEKPYAFYFPVLCDGEIVLVYTVGYDFYNMEISGRPCYTSSMSEGWAKELREFCEKARPNDPILFYHEKNNHTMVKNGEDVSFLAYCPGVLEAPDYTVPDVPAERLMTVPLTQPLFSIDTPKDFAHSTVIHSPAELETVSGGNW